MDFEEIKHQGYIEIFLLVFRNLSKVDDLIVNLIGIVNLMGFIRFDKKILKKWQKNILVFCSILIMVLFKNKIRQSMRGMGNIRDVYSSILRFMIFEIMKNFGVFGKRKAAEIFMIAHVTEQGLTRSIEDGHIWIIDFFGFHILTIFSSYALSSTLTSISTPNIPTRAKKLLAPLLIFCIPIFIIMPIYQEKVLRLLKSEIWTIAKIFSVIPVFALVSFLLIKKNQNLKVYIRKIFHLLVLVIFTSLISQNFNIIFFGFTGMVTLFILLENIRIEFSESSSLVQKAGHFFEIFKDEKDADGLIASHIYLLVGCLYPIIDNYWIYATFGMKKKSEFFFRNLIGLIFVGVSDSMAAIFGKRFGRIKIHGNKTLTGFLAYFTSSILTFWIFGNLPLLNPKIILLSLFAGLLELLSDQNDNLIVPILALAYF